MRKPVVLTLFIALAWTMVSYSEEAAPVKAGRTLFKQHCAMCHPGGNNIINPNKTLHKKDLEKYNITTEKNIIAIIRNGRPGMTKFDDNAISDGDARLIARYVLKAFK